MGRMNLTPALISVRRSIASRLPTSRPGTRKDVKSYPLKKFFEISASCCGSRPKYRRMDGTSTHSIVPSPKSFRTGTLSPIHIRPTPNTRHTEKAPPILSGITPIYAPIMTARNMNRNSSAGIPLTLSFDFISISPFYLVFYCLKVSCSAADRISPPVHCIRL